MEYHKAFVSEVLQMIQDLPPHASASLFKLQVEKMPLALPSTHQPSPELVPPAPAAHVDSVELTREQVIAGKCTRKSMMQWCRRNLPGTAGVRSMKKADLQTLMLQHL